MDDSGFNMSIRQFLKQVGVTSQREIERLLRSREPEAGPLRVKMALTAQGTSLEHVIEGVIEGGVPPERGAADRSPDRSRRTSPAPRG